MSNKRKNNYAHGKRCPYCGSTVGLRNSKEITGHGSSLLWVCNDYPNCDAYVSCEKNTGRPLGNLANKNLRKLRIEAHQAFDKLFTNGSLSKDDAYIWLHQNIVPEKPMKYAHIALFNEKQCLEVIENANFYLNNFNT